MKESTNKTAGRTQTGQNKSATKSSRTTTSHASSTSRGTAKSQSSATGPRIAQHNPEGHNQYTKNRRATANDAVRLSIECRKGLSDRVQAVPSFIRRPSGRPAGDSRRRIVRQQGGHRFCTHNQKRLNDEKGLGLYSSHTALLRIGRLVGWWQNDAIREWYPHLVKPALTPPNAAFPIAWSIIYLCMGLSAGLVLTSVSPLRRRVMALWFAQLGFNVLWSILFFVCRSPCWE